MNEIILYFTKKYDGDWEAIYKAINDKESVELKDIQSVFDDVRTNYLSIIDRDYPNKFKDIFMPPFSLFHAGEKELLENKIIGLQGYGNEHEIKFVEMLIRHNFTFIVINNIKNQKLISLLKAKQTPLILVNLNGINKLAGDLRIDNQKNILLVSERPDNIIVKDQKIQRIERIIIALADLVIVFARDCNSSNSLVETASLENKKIGFIKPIDKSVDYPSHSVNYKVLEKIDDIVNLN